MEAENRISNAIERAVIEFVEYQESFKQAEAEFKKKKEEFFSLMRNAHNNNVFERKFEFNKHDKRFSVTRSVRKTVKFDADKLELKLPRDIRKSVIIKEYIAEDFAGLAKYVKSLGGDPEVFKSFFSIDKKVDVKELERLEGIGEVTEGMIDGCYVVTVGNPTFLVREKVLSSDGESK